KQGRQWHAENFSHCQSPAIQDGRSYAEVSLDPGCVGLELVVRDHVHDTATLHDVVTVGDAGGEPKVLLHKQNGETLLLELGNGAADLLYDDWGQAFGRLVQQQQPGASPKDPTDSEHLLLAAG